MITIKKFISSHHFSPAWLFVVKMLFIGTTPREHLPAGNALRGKRNAHSLGSQKVNSNLVLWR